MKKWLLRYGVFFLFLLIVISIVNYIIDPLWTFNNPNSMQTYRDGFNERQQKINVIKFVDVKFDSIIIGSSRVTIHNQLKIGKNVFNLSADGMLPSEFNAYVEFAKKTKVQKIKVIYLGLDFLPVANNFSDSNITKYINTSDEFLFRYKNLINYDTTKHSMNALRNKFAQRYKKKFKTYNEKFVATTHSQNEMDIKLLVEKIASKIYNKTLQYDREEYIQNLRTLKENNPNTTFIIFTTPKPTPILKAIFKNKLNHMIYKQWINDILDIFGEVNNFVYKNEVSDNFHKNFVDEAHYSSNIADCIDDYIINKNNLNCNNLGQKIDKNNIFILDDNINEMVEK